MKQIHFFDDGLPEHFDPFTDIPERYVAPSNPGLQFDPVDLTPAAQAFADRHKHNFYDKAYPYAIYAGKRLAHSVASERVADMEFYVRQRCRDAFTDQMDRRHFDALCKVFEIHTSQPFKFRPLDYDKVDKVIEWLTEKTIALRVLNLRQQELEV